MSKITLSSNALGTGTFTIASPNSNTDRTLSLPNASGTVQVSDNPISGTTASFSGAVTLGSSVLATPTGSAPSYTCRAWVNFNGTGTVAIRASGNVSSITDNGVGDYTVNFSTAMPDANYSAKVSSSKIYPTTAQDPTEGPGKPVNLLAGSCQVITHFHVMNISSSPHDSGLVCVDIFR